MKRIFSRPLAHVSQRGWRAVLVVVLLGAILAFGMGSFAPSAHAVASASSSPSTSAVITIRTSLACSVRVIQASPISKQGCYNTPNHTVTITGWKGTVEFLGYSNANCSGRILCRVIRAIPPSGFLIIILC